jgi:hypothetical protein
MSVQDPIRNRLAEHLAPICYEHCDITGCNQLLLNGTQDAHKEICSFIRVKCSLFNIGCSWIGYIGDRELHEQHCYIGKKSKQEIVALLDNYATGKIIVSCVYQMAGCEWIGEKCVKLIHETTDCIYSKFTSCELAREVEQEQARIREEIREQKGAVQQQFDDGMGPTSFGQDFYSGSGSGSGDEYEEDGDEFTPDTLERLLEIHGVVAASHTQPPRTQEYSPTSPSYLGDDDEVIEIE